MLDSTEMWIARMLFSAIDLKDTDTIDLCKHTEDYYNC